MHQQEGQHSNVGASSSAAKAPPQPAPLQPNAATTAAASSSPTATTTRTATTTTTTTTTATTTTTTSAAPSAAAIAAAEDVARAIVAHPDPHLVFRDAAAVTRKVAQILAAGVDAFHIVTDFDMTVTRYWQNGERSPSSHAVLMRSEATGPEFKRRSDELYHKYYPIEIDSTLPYEVRRQAMEDWWVQAHQVIVDAKLTRPDLTRMVAATPVAYRDGVRELFAACAARDIPVLVFSAGLYDVIKEILEAAALKPPNVHIVSNRMQFDPDTGVCTSFASPLIHVFNKNEAKIAGSPYEASLAGRSRVLLMGDSLGDLQMGDGIACETLLTVGFLNHDTEKHLSAYTAAFDVVVIDDAPMDFANRIVEGFKEVATRVAAAAAAAATAGVNGTGAV